MAMDLSKSKNANKMRSIQEKSNEQGSGLVTINIPLDQIDENPDNEKTFNMEKVDSIARSIEQLGFYGAINVFKKPDGRYEISSGHSRFRAMKKLGKLSIPCCVCAYPDEFRRGLMLLSSNVHNRVMRPMDWANSIEYYYELMKNAKKEHGKGDQSYTGRLRDQAAEFFDMSPANIQKYYSLLKLIPNLQEMANNPEFAYSAFFPAATLSKEDQLRLYENITDELEKNAKRAEAGEGIAGVSRMRIEQLINDIKNKPDNTAQKNKQKGNFNVAFPMNSPAVQEDEFRDISDTVEVPTEFDNHFTSVDETDTDGPVYTDMADGAYGNDGSMNPRTFGEEDDIASMEITSSSKQSSNIDAEGLRSADVLLTSFAPEIEKVVSGVYDIYNKEKAKRYLKRIKDAIDEIEKML